ncbi:MAG TPA: recombination protein RecR [Phycisphaerales bacterium]|nr:recombination protein RecR [Phycisphaerales bacterium]
MSETARHHAGGSPAYPAPVERLLVELTRLPGIGRRSAERLAFHILKGDAEGADRLARAIQEVKSEIGHCSVCSNLTEADPCPICTNPKRDRTMVLVVEQPKDLIALEQTAMYGGLYHVLLGRVSPLDGIGPESLTIADLLRRVDDPAGNPDGVAIQEVILGMNPTVEGDGTALYLMEQLRDRPVRVSRLARGLPSGWSMEMASKAVLADAIEGRRQLKHEPGGA